MASFTPGAAAGRDAPLDIARAALLFIGEPAACVTNTAPPVRRCSAQLPHCCVEASLPEPPAHTRPQPRTADTQNFNIKREGAIYKGTREEDNVRAGCRCWLQLLAAAGGCRCCQ